MNENLGNHGGDGEAVIETEIQGERQETDAKTPIDGLIRNLVLLEKVDEELEKLRRDEGMKKVREELKAKQEKLLDAIGKFDETVVREAKAIRSTIKRVGAEDAVEEISDIIDAKHEARERVVQSILDWEREIGVETDESDVMSRSGGQ